MENNKEQKCYGFAVRIYKLCRYLQKTRKEYIITNQLFRSGTSIGANLAESKFAQSSADFISKHSIALKEAAESEYWIRLLRDTNIINETEFKSLKDDIDEIIKILTTIIKRLKENQ